MIPYVTHTGDRVFIIEHSAWPTPAPPVDCGWWGQHSWDVWGERYRPNGYEGDIHDEVAYAEWLETLKEAGA